METSTMTSFSWKNVKPLSKYRSNTTETTFSINFLVKAKV